MDLVLLLGVAVALVVGAAIGWLIRSAPLAAAQSSAAEIPELRRIADSLRDQRDQAERDLAAARAIAGQVVDLQKKLESERTRSEAFAIENGAMVRGEEERRQAHENQLSQLAEVGKRLDMHFGELAAKALNEAQGLFLKRADERFRQSEEKSGDSLKALLQPVSDRLQRYEEG